MNIVYLTIVLKIDFPQLTFRERLNLGNKFIANIQKPKCKRKKILEKNDIDIYIAGTVNKEVPSDGRHEDVDKSNSLKLAVT